MGSNLRILQRFRDFQSNPKTGIILLDQFSWPTGCQGPDVRPAFPRRIVALESWTVYEHARSSGPIAHECARELPACSPAACAYGSLAPPSAIGIRFAQVFDDDDDRSLIENCCIKESTQPWSLGHPSKKTARAVRVHVVFTLFMFALGDGLSLAA